MSGYIFLDIDGVLIDYTSLQESRGDLLQHPNPNCVAALNWLTDNSEAEIVVSSVWRLGGQERIATILKGWGVTGNVIGITPELARKEPNGTLVANRRGEEIATWLRDQPIKPFVILDDDKDMGHLVSFLIRTSYETGLTMRHAQEALNHLRFQANRLKRLGGK